MTECELLFYDLPKTIRAVPILDHGRCIILVNAFYLKGTATIDIIEIVRNLNFLGI